MKSKPIRIFNFPSHQMGDWAGVMMCAVAVVGIIAAISYFFAYEEARGQYLLSLRAHQGTLNALHELQKDRTYLLKKNLDAEISDLHDAYHAASISYEHLADLRLKIKTQKLDISYAHVVDLLAKRAYASAKAEIATLEAQIKKETEKADAEASGGIPENAPIINAAPENGYRRQYVQNTAGTYIVDVIAADLSRTRVIVDTASDHTCTNDCPVGSLGTFASRSGAFAGINGPYFCPAAYPSCAGKTNSFDTLLMNKNKVYFNSDNNVYSTVPAVIFQNGSARYVGKTLEWGRDAGPDSVIAAQPMLVSGGQSVFGGDGDVKKSGRGPRSFIGSTGSRVFIGVVYNASVSEAAAVLVTMGIQNALNLDSGGSTALWSGGRYIVGPGRDTPFGIVFVAK